MPSSRPLIGRRTVLVGLTAAGLALAGCTGTGELPQPTDPPAPPTPTPLPGTPEAAAIEQGLALRCATIAIRFADRLSPGERRLLSRLCESHRAHADVLDLEDPVRLPDPSPGPGSAGATPSGSAEPTPARTAGSTPSGRPASATALPTSVGSASAPPLGRNAEQALQRLRELEGAAADSHRSRALDPDGPDDQLPRLTQLWGSLTVAAELAAAALERGGDPGEDVLGGRRLEAVLPDPDEAVAAVVAQCHPLIYGYQTAIAGLSGSATGQGLARLADIRRLRDRLSAELADDGADVPAAEPGYRLPLDPDSDGRARRLTVAMERRLQPYLGQWLATAQRRSDRRQALAALTDSSRFALRWTGRITVWPGWPTED